MIILKMYRQTRFQPGLKKKKMRGLIVSTSKFIFNVLV